MDLLKIALPKNRFMTLPATLFRSGLTLVLLALARPLRAAEPPSESQLISILQSSTGFAEKNAACWELKRVGTAASVPALAALLIDERLSHSARYALESMLAPEAGTALLAALQKTTGPVRVGIIQSLGARGEVGAVVPLAPLLSQPDAEAAAAAATALGRIDDLAAGVALAAAKAQLATGGATNVRRAVLDAMLQRGQRLLALGERAQALSIFEQLFQDRISGNVRLAAYRGMVLASEEGAGLDLLTRALSGSDGPSQAAALALVPDFKPGSATVKLAGLLARLSPTVQVALIGVLAQRGDAAAAPAIAAVAKSADAHVRIAALAALGLLDDTSSVALLAEGATAGGEEQAAARRSLQLLHQGKPADAMLAALPTATPAVQAELARALGERSEVSAIPRLFTLARGGSDSVAKAALLALAELVNETQIPDLVRLVVQAKGDPTRTEAAEALNTAMQRLQAKLGRVDTAPVVEALTSAPAPARIVLLPVAGGLAEPRVRAALRAALTDADVGVRGAAVRALAETVDPDLLPDLLQAAKKTAEPGLRSVAIAGWVRLAIREQTGKVPLATQVEGLATLIATPLSVEQKRFLLSGIGEVVAPDTLAMAAQLLAEASVHEEAAQAVIKIARALPDSALGTAAVKQVLASPNQGSLHQSATAVLQEIQARATYVTAWKIAGPYLQEGKDYSALFDIPFPPETDGTGEWRPIPAGTDAKRPWLMDLLKALGGEQRVAYARTFLYSEKAIPARLEVGTDDGVKIWLNHKFLHGNNASRALAPGSDRVNVQLEAGWNLLLLKITQNNQGWEFCARVVNPDGSPIEALKIDASR